MRINIYKEELTKRIEVITKVVDGITYTGLRIYLYMPVTTKPHNMQVRGPFLHRAGDDDSSAVTFWADREEIHQLIFAMKSAMAESGAHL